MIFFPLKYHDDFSFAGDCLQTFTETFIETFREGKG